LTCDPHLTVIVFDTWSNGKIIQNQKILGSLCEEPTDGSFRGTGRGLKAMDSRWRCTMKERASARTRESVAREKQRVSK
jgi:hypothetical protein